MALGDRPDMYETFEKLPADLRCRYAPYSELCSAHSMFHVHDILWKDERVGYLHGLSKMMRQESIQREGAEELLTIVDEELEWIPGPAPQRAEAAKSAFLTPLLSTADVVSQVTKSAFGRRVRNLGSLVTCLSALSLTHYCWHSESMRPCCASREECVGKVFIALATLQLWHPPAAPIGRDLLSVRKSFVWFSVGTGVNSFLPRLLLRVFARSIGKKRPRRPDEHEQSYLTEMFKVRKRNVLKLIQDPQAWRLIYAYCIVAEVYSCAAWTVMIDVAIHK